MTAPRTFFLAALIYACMSGALHAQLIGESGALFNFNGEAQSDNFGYSVSGAGDVNGDGVPDIIVGAHHASPGGLIGAGSAFVYSGATGALIWRFDGVGVYDNLGTSVSDLGDVNGDGFADVIVGSDSGDGDLGNAIIYSGATGLEIRRFIGLELDDVFGTSVSSVGDLDGDGVPDVIIGAPKANPGGRGNAGAAYVYSSVTGALIWQFDGAVAGDRQGQSVSDAGDVDGDGVPDMIVGIPFSTHFGISNNGAAAVYSGATGAITRTYFGDAAGDYMGSSVSNAGDIDGDGFADQIVGATDHDFGALTRAGAAYVYSGATGSAIWVFYGANAGDGLGSSVSTAGDMDGDGVPDLLIGASAARSWGRASTGSVYVYSGATGAEILQFVGVAAHDSYGIAASTVGDVDGDGIPDLAVGADHADPNGVYGAGSAYVYSQAIDPYLYLDSDELSMLNGVLLGVDIDFPASEAGYGYAVLASSSGIGPTTHAGISIPLTADSLFNRMLNGLAPHGPLDANGDAHLDLRLHRATPAAAVGRTLYLAAVSIEPVTFNGRLATVARGLLITP